MEESETDFRIRLLGDADIWISLVGGRRELYEVLRSRRYCYNQPCIYSRAQYYYYVLPTIVYGGKIYPNSRDKYTSWLLAVCGTRAPIITWASRFRSKGWKWEGDISKSDLRTWHA